MSEKLAKSPKIDQNSKNRTFFKMVKSDKFENCHYNCVKAILGNFFSGKCKKNLSDFPFFAYFSKKSLKKLQNIYFFISKSKRRDFEDFKTL